METRSVADLQVFVEQGNKEAKRELAKRFLEGKDVDKNESKAVSLLEECVTLGDSHAMLALAKCCALGYGMEQNVERAEALISEASIRKNKDAKTLVKLINEWKGKERVDLASLFLRTLSHSQNSFQMHECLL